VRDVGQDFDHLDEEANDRDMMDYETVDYGNEDRDMMDYETVDYGNEDRDMMDYETVDYGNEDRDMMNYETVDCGSEDQENVFDMADENQFDVRLLYARHARSQVCMCPLYAGTRATTACEQVQGMVNAQPVKQ
jgi:hypothetical protein